MPRDPGQVPLQRLLPCRDGRAKNVRKARVAHDRERRARRLEVAELAQTPAYGVARALDQPGGMSQIERHLRVIPPCRHASVAEVQHAGLRAQVGHKALQPCGQVGDARGRAPFVLDEIQRLPGSRALQHRGGHIPAARAEKPGHPRHQRLGACGEHGLFTRELRASVDIHRTRGRVLIQQRAAASVENIVRAQMNEPRAAPGAFSGEHSGSGGVQRGRVIRALLAGVRAGQAGRVHQCVKLQRAQLPRQRRGLRRIQQTPARRHHLMTPLPFSRQHPA